jgi:hypothetical protein
MNEMYHLSIGIHDAGVFILVGLILLNMLLLATAREIIPYAKRMRMLMPLSGSMIAVIIFTGMVMMAAKRLDFTLENIVMIVFSIVLIVLEAKRYKTLKRRTDITQPDAFALYKRKAMRLMAIALGGSVLISFWMLV